MNKIFYISAIIFALFAQNSFAKIGNMQSINSLSFNDGEAFSNKNHKQAFNGFVEYPLSKKTSVGGVLQASHTNSNYAGSKAPLESDAYALNSVELFHRYKFFSADKFGATVQNSFKFPGVYQVNKNLGLMPQQQDYEVRLLLAYNMKDRLINNVLRSENAYWFRVEPAYRKRFSNPFDEVRLRFWGGINLSKKFEFLLQDDTTWNVKSKADAVSNSYSNITNFQGSKDANNVVTLSLVYRVNENVAVQTGYLRRLRGNNPFYDYQGVMVGLWTSFGE